ncbi:MAG: hypothetical protein ACE5K2_09455, partial [Candidatus Zixiibacteriota bacterium]
MKLKITFVLLIAGLVFTLGISCPPKEYLCDPSQQGGPKMKMEYDYQEGYRLDDFHKLYDNVQGAFDFVGTETEICRDESFAPDTFWRDELPGFFQNHKNSSLEYYLVSVVALYENQGVQYK